MPNPHIQFRPERELAQQIRARTAQQGEDYKDAWLSATAARDLERYYAVLATSLVVFSLPEASLIVDALNGTRLDVWTAKLLWASVEDAIREDALDAKWGVAGRPLVTRLQNLSLVETLAVLDAVERFWNTSSYAISEMEDRLVLVGLVAQ